MFKKIGMVWVKLRFSKWCIIFADIVQPCNVQYQYEIFNVGLHGS